MTQAGQKLAQIRDQLVQVAAPGVLLEDIENLANSLIREAGGKPSFAMVPGYHWATCISLNDAIVHGIPKGQFKSGDMATIDVGMFFQGFHTDTAFSFVVGESSPQKDKFLKVGQDTLAKTIELAKPGNKVRDLSACMQKSVEAAGYGVVRSLTGHGIGRILHDEPSIPCFVESGPSSTLKVGQTIAVEVMYTMGNYETVTDKDGWTVRTIDGSLTAVFEHTLVVADPPQILTKP